MTRDRSGNIYVTGSRYSHASLGDFVTVKYNPSGVEQWVVLYDGPAHAYDTAFDIEVDSLGYVYVTGPSVSTEDDYLTIKYRQTTGIKEITKQMPRLIREIGASPNPFRNATCIKFQLSNAKCRLKLAIFDVSGRLVRRFDYMTLRQSDYIIWDGADDAGKQLPPGVYFIELKSGNLSQTVRVVLID
jgi:hypothetical protein